RAPMSRIHHHRAHLLSAVATSGFESGWAISMDGKGDLLAGMVAQVGPPLRIRREISLLDSPGIFYSAITRLLGFRADEDEGKTTALAAGGGGSPRIDALLARELSWTGGDLRFHTLRGRAARAALVKLPTDAVAADLAAALGRAGGADRGEIAAAAQRRLETVVVGLLDDAVADQGPVDLAVAGGVFANVSLNRVLSRHPAVRRLFVHPAMGDSGLAVGACVGAHQRLTGVIPALPLRDVFLGTGIEDAAVADLLSRRQIPFRRPAALAERVGRLLAAGATVGVCRGRMEYGPRALGHRSILCHPGDPQLTARLNASLGRSAVMPFAPAIADEQLSSCVDLRPEERRNAGFMTLAVPATRRLRDLCPAAVHVDGTARVQAVDRGTTPFLHGVIRAFGKRTGIPAVINTSLNRHREPIVRSAEDALRTASAAGLDALVLGEVLIDGTDLRGSGSGQTRQQR
ncbi:MAG: carbamoyltransferase C-terminal domain-containing protein, partial [Myxococcota bacterium]|nr:carbamoyltransferase C-terminal domain-containing protein [Myxococcota bacterium]